MDEILEQGRAFINEFKACRAELDKRAFTQTADPSQMPPPGAPPMDPNQMPPGGPPMDPNQMPPGAMPPGAPPMDPSQMPPPGAMPPGAVPAGPPAGGIPPELEGVLQGVTGALGNLQQDREVMQQETAALGDAQLNNSQQISELMQSRQQDQETIKTLSARLEALEKSLAGPAPAQPSAE